jgi:Flp pilus assembly pilin Flp
MPEGQTMSVQVSAPPGAVAGLLHAFIRDTSGATAIEYSIMAAGIGMAVATTVWGVGSALKANFYDSLAAMF